MHTAQRKADMRACAVRYESRFNLSLAERMRQLLAAYPDVNAPNWLSWEGARFTNVTTSSGLRRWLSVLSEKD